MWMQRFKIQSGASRLFYIHRNINFIFFLEFISSPFVAVFHASGRDCSQAIKLPEVCHEPSRPQSDKASRSASDLVVCMHKMHKTTKIGQWTDGKRIRLSLQPILLLLWWLRGRYNASLQGVGSLRQDLDEVN